MATQPLTASQHAIATVFGLSRFKRFENAAIFDIVNKLLKDGGEEAIGRDTFDNDVKLLTDSKFIEFDVSGKYWKLFAPAGARQKRPQRDSQAADAARLRGDSYFLYNKALKSKYDILYIIHHNCDGKGSSMLPSGKVVNDNLNALNRRAHEENGKDSTGNGGGGDQWVISPTHHKNLATKTQSVRTWRTYLNANYKD